MSYQDREFEIQEVQAGGKIISHFIDNCMKDNTKRLMLDTREFAQWLCQKIADISEKNVDIDE